MFINMHVFKCSKLIIIKNYNERSEHRTVMGDKQGKGQSETIYNIYIFYLRFQKGFFQQICCLVKSPFFGENIVFVAGLISKQQQQCNLLEFSGVVFRGSILS
eukprot:TRINITY_DN81750_c0_g1_i1.p6 TRINITY_DN81750_c0_g1~~TRINITY_DN81750_c0_g1_i1.p6  ORF type:complete len:103 (-),score=6.72 TRINITY_DN81750_c0_g1_i1:105-413(-)